MKIQHLRFFAAVVEYGGVTRAAERLRLSQPAVSAGLKALEHEVGRPLFDRGRDRRLRLTADGETFRRHAAAILRECDAAKAALGPVPRRQAVRLGIASTLATDSLVIGLARLRERRPEVALSFREGPPERLERWLAQERLDAALTVTAVDAAADQFLLIRDEAFVALLPPGHRWTGRNAIDLAELDGERFVLRLACELRRAAQARTAAAGIVLDVVARAATDALAIRLVEAGVGITLAPASLRPPHLAALAVRDFGLVRRVGLRWRAEAMDAALAEDLAGLGAARTP